MGSLAEGFLKGMQIGEQQKEQARRARLQEDQAKEEKRQRSIAEQLQARTLGLQDLEFLKGQHTPTEQLPEGVQGPPATLRQAVMVPGVPALGVQGREVQPQYMEDVLAQQRAQEDLKKKATLDLFAEQQRLRDASELVPVDEATAKELGLAGAGSYDPKIIETKKALKALNIQDQTRRDIAAGNNQARADAAAERKRAKDEAAAEKKSLKDQAISAYVDSLRDGSMSSEAIPAAYKGEVLAAAKQAGVKPLSRKQIEDVQAFQSFENQAQQIKETFVPSAVGMVEGRIPDMFSNAQTATYRANVAGLFNELGKLRSGGAITPQEYERLRLELPDVRDTETVFKSKLDRFLGALAMKRQSILEPLNRGGAKESTGTAAPVAGKGGGGSPDPLGLF